MKTADVKDFQKDPRLPGNYYVLHLPEVGSTNVLAKELAEAGTPDRSVILTDKQTAGIGKHQRKWHDPAGNLACTLIIRPQNCLPQAAQQFTFIASLAIHQAISSWMTPDTQAAMKWPNDVMVGGAKVSGILTELALNPETQMIDWAVIGMGINVLEAPDIAGVRTACVKDNSNRSDLTTKAVFYDLVNAFENHYQQWQDGKIDDLRHAWQDKAYGVGQQISFKAYNITYKGTYLGVDNNGYLRLQRSDGIVMHLTSGDVIFEE